MRRDRIRNRLDTRRALCSNQTMRNIWQEIDARRTEWSIELVWREKSWRAIDADMQRGPDYIGERKDCTVHATAIAAQIPYFEAHALLARFGRKPRKGISYASFVTMLKVQHITIGEYRVERVTLDRPVTLSQFLRDFPKGRFVVRRLGHVFAVIDGQQFDTMPNGMRVKLTDIYHFTKGAQ